MSNHFPSVTTGFAAVFTSEGELIRWLRDDLSLRDQYARRFQEMIEGEENRVAQFIKDLAELNAAFGWEFPTRVRGGLQRLYYAGANSPEGFLVVATLTPVELLGAMQELVRMNNEQTTALRQALKELSLRDRERSRSDEHLYGEMSRLNNELVTLQRELARKNHDLDQLNQLKNRFLGMASHDLRKPLSVILMNIDQLQSLPLPLDAERPIASIQETTQEVLNTLSDFLDQASIEAGKFKINPGMTDLCKLLREREIIWQFWARGYKKSLNLASGEETLVLPADDRRLKQVLDNLVENALKYSTPGSPVDISLRMDGAEAVLKVADHGPGLTEESRRCLFQPFAADRSRDNETERGSSGLGLAIVKAVIDAHGGMISVESSSAGTIFEIRLPVVSEGRNNIIR